MRKLRASPGPVNTSFSENAWWAFGDVGLGSGWSPTFCLLFDLGGCLLIFPLNVIPLCVKCIPGSPMEKNLPVNAGDMGDQIWSRGQEDPLEEEVAISVFLPGKSHGQRSLEGWSPWGCERVRYNWATQHTRLLKRAASLLFSGSSCSG